MKKCLSLLLVAAALTALTAGCSFANGERIGVLAPIGVDEEGVRQWSKNVAEAEGRTAPSESANTIVLYDSLNAMLMDLMAGHIDRISIAKTVGAYIAAWNPNFRLHDNHYNPIIGYSIAMRQEDGAAMGAIDQAIEAMKADGTLNRLARRLILDADPELTLSMDMPRFEDAETIKIAVTGDLPPLDIIRADGTPGGFNTAFLAELSQRIRKNFQLIPVEARARQAALESRRVDAVFWTRGVYDRDAKPLPYPLDVMGDVLVSKPYFLDSRVSLSWR